MKTLLKMATEAIAAENEVGPDWIRSRHTRPEFARGAVKDIKAQVAALSDIHTLRLEGTDANGEAVSLEFRTRMSDDVYYSNGNAYFDVAKKDYQGSLAPFKTLVHVGGLSSKEAVEQAKKAIEDLVS